MQQIEIEKASSSLDENTELWVLQIRMASNELNENRGQIKITQQSAELAKDNLRISQDNYKAGIIGISDLLEAQALYQQSLDNHTEALCNFRIKLAEYLVSTGAYQR